MGTSIHALFPSNFLKAADLKGQRRTVTITKITREEIGKGKERKAVVYFAEAKKGLVLNKTNAVKIAKVTGFDDYTQWPGKKIALVATEVEFKGDLTPAIRVDGVGSTEGGGDVFSTDGDNDSAFGGDANDDISDSDNPPA